MLCARETFHTGDRTVVKGELVDPENDVVEGREEFFEVADCPSCGGAGGDEAAVAALTDLQTKLDEVTAERDAAIAERDAALEAATKAPEPAKISTAKAKG